MNEALDAIFQRRAVKVFEPVEISEGLREQILNAARHAPSSFNSQPYKFYWAGSAPQKAVVAKLCLGQKPAETASGMFAAIKRALFRLLNLRKVIGMPPLSRQDLFKWATKSTSLACQNLMIAAEALGMNTCPMEGFDGRRLSRYLGLSGRHHEIVMVIAIGKKSRAHNEPPQWRRPLDATVTIL